MHATRHSIDAHYKGKEEELVSLAAHPLEGPKASEEKGISNQGSGFLYRAITNYDWQPDYGNENYKYANAKEEEELDFSIVC
jgi:hypothetical protein